MSTAPVAIAIAGASGRMGHMLVEAVLATPGCRLSGALDRPGAPSLGQDAGAFMGRDTGVAVTADLAQGLAGAQVLIDFTRPEGTLAHLEACRAAGCGLVIGTTGFTEAQKAVIAEHARHVPVFFAPNMSVGVHVVMTLLRQAGALLGDEYDVEIVEAHHRHKVDAPSGTALKMGEVVAEARGRRLADCQVLSREGLTGERVPGTIGFAAVRGGDIIGDHTVMFAGTGERIEISHKSASRAGYAQGALRAARFLAQRGTPGLFDMDDLLGMR